MKSSFKNTIILLFQRIDKAVFDLHRSGSQWNTIKVPHWVVFILVLISYFLILWQFWPLLSASKAPFLKYFDLFAISIITILFLIMAKIYISQLLGYKSPYPIPPKKKTVNFYKVPIGPPIRFSQLVHTIEYSDSNLFRNYLKTSEKDFKQFLLGEKLNEKMVWLPLTDKKLPNFRLFFEFLNHICEENLEGYYGENLLRLCTYVKDTFKSKDTYWTVKQLQKAHSGWKNCNPKRRMDLKIDIENHLLPRGN